MIILYHSPMTCSLASKLALVEAGLDHEVHYVRTYRDEHHAPDYLALNPAGKVPALSVDGVIVSESSAILPLIADLAPEAGLLPTEKIARAQAQSTLSFLSSSLHSQFRASMFPERSAGTGDIEAVRTVAMELLPKALLLLEGRVAGKGQLLDQFSICDIYLTVFLLWRGHPVLQGKLPDTPCLDALKDRVLARPGLQAALDEDFAIRQQN